MSRAPTPPRLATQPAQGGHMDMNDFRRALAELPADQREALILVGASGFSYEEAAEICECAVGTIKSRVSRARTRLAEILKLEQGETYGSRSAFGERDHPHHRLIATRVQCRPKFAVMSACRGCCGPVGGYGRNVPDAGW